MPDESPSSTIMHLCHCHTSSCSFSHACMYPYIHVCIDPCTSTCPSWHPSAISSLSNTSALHCGCMYTCLVACAHACTHTRLPICVDSSHPPVGLHASARTCRAAFAGPLSQRPEQVPPPSCVPVLHLEQQSRQYCHRPRSVAPHEHCHRR